jgi:uncharacterized membrane protein HdeD (DUF308 family)
MTNPRLLRLSATLALVGGALVTLVARYLHPNGGSTEEDTLTSFAASGNWMAIHLMQFTGMALILTGLIVLLFALNVAEGAPRWIGFFGAISAGVALALASVVFAIDGVANKQAAKAFVNAPAAEKAARFASAEALRWLEWGTTSYQDFTIGLALILFAIAIVATARVPRLLGGAMAVSGVAYLAQGWVIGTTGFTSATTLTTDVGYTLLFVSMIWLLIVSWQVKKPVQAAHTPR